MPKNEHKALLQYQILVFIVGIFSLGFCTILSPPSVNQILSLIILALIILVLEFFPTEIFQYKFSLCHIIVFTGAMLYGTGLSAWAFVIGAGAAIGIQLLLPARFKRAHSTIQPGDTVLDLGSGAGFDCFLAAKKVGSTGKVIGVDMTPEMIDKARSNANQGQYTNVEFRLGEIEHLPVADNRADIIMSNWVINLSPDKASKQTLRPVAGPHGAIRSGHRLLAPRRRDEEE